MRFTFFLLIALVVLATFTPVVEARTGQYQKPVSLQGENRIRVKCAVGHQDCNCWDCKFTHVLACKYIC